MLNQLELEMFKQDTFNPACYISTIISCVGYDRDKLPGSGYSNHALPLIIDDVRISNAHFPLDDGGFESMYANRVFCPCA